MKNSLNSKQLDLILIGILCIDPFFYATLLEKLSSIYIHELNDNLLSFLINYRMLNPWRKLFFSYNLSLTDLELEILINYIFKFIKKLKFNIIIEDLLKSRTLKEQYKKRYLRYFRLCMNKNNVGNKFFNDDKKIIAISFKIISYLTVKLNKK